ncbi:MAG: IS3 family transposase [Succinivibrio sp.]|nr:IS3 family transposase [Succinivibrio sp.]
MALDYITRLRNHQGEDLEIKKLIDQIYTEHPEYGYRRICWWLNEKQHITINHKAVLRYMRQMGIQAIYPRQNTSKAEPGHKVYPYLLKDLEIDHPNSVWSIDITYIPVKTDWLYLVAIIDWYSRYVLSWEINDSLEIDFGLEACKTALKDAKPEIMNSDQGSHFTSERYTELFLNAGAKISMDHRGRAYDNIFIERLWSTIKYEDIYPRAYDSPKEARIGINRYLEYYNRERPHSVLEYKTPETVYRDKR